MSKKPYVIPVDELPVRGLTSNRVFFRSSHQQVIPGDVYDADPIFKEDWYDPLDDKLRRVIRSVQTVSVHEFSRDQPITTIAFKYASTASAWWVILLFNGYVHPDEIPDGANLSIPDFQEVARLLQKKKSLVGTTFKF